jgi:6-phosphogluconate dehydrogenase
MKVGMVGLGRMGMGMALRLLEKKVDVVGWNRTAEKARELLPLGGGAVARLDELPSALDAPRTVWVMLPAGEATEWALDLLARFLSPGDTVISGGNTHFADDLRWSQRLAERGVEHLDAGVSGGIWGRERGYCLMVGGKREAFLRHQPLFAALAPPEGFLHCGPAGSGHFVKMVHNGVEYALLQAYAEGFALMEKGPYAKELDLAGVSHLWNQGSVVRSWLLALAERAFAADPALSGVRGVVADSGEGRWMVEEAVKRGVAVPAIAASLFARFSSREEDLFADRFIAALRNQFGGHDVVRR